MAVLGVDDFKAKLRGGGARPNLFKVTVNYPAIAGGDAELTSFMCEAAQLPGSSIGTIPIPFRGRQLKVAGDRTFEPWSVTVINDGEFNIRKAFEKWSRGINAHTENVGQLGYGADGGESYCRDMTVYQLSRDGQKPSKTPSNIEAPGVDGLDVVRAYRFYDAWPSSLSAIDLSYESNDQIEEFTVDFQYNYFEVTKSSLEA